ncbi:7-keto-8-aminopelargonate synthetase and related enzymes [Mycobacteroides abscessus subsp. massiliense]|nr:7-keto-8-aminopelargonate synthetase and related enzymes [Mycobacteroides abscessus subsp. massiliense]
MGCQTFLHTAAQHLVKQEFRVAIYIERFFQFALFAEDFALAIYSSAGSIKKWNTFILTPVQEVERVLVVVVHHVKAVMIHGIGTCTLMENGFNIVVRQKMAAHLADKFVFIEIMGNFTLGKVFKFFTFAQIVDGNNVGNTALVKCFDDVAADKAGRACYDNGHNEFPLF